MFEMGRQKIKIFHTPHGKKEMTARKKWWQERNGGEKRNGDKKEMLARMEYIKLEIATKNKR